MPFSMLGNEIKISVNNNQLPLQTSCEINMSVEMVEYQPLPSSDDGWKYYNPGSFDWSANVDMLYSTDDNIMSEIAGSGQDVDLSVVLGNISLSGSAFISAASFEAQNNSMTRLKAMFNGNNKIQKQ